MPVDANADPAIRCLQAVADGIRSIMGTGKPIDEPRLKLYEKYAAEDRSGINYPAVVVSLLGAGPETYAPGGNCYDDIGYPAPVVILGSESKVGDTDATKYLKWRHLIGRKFHGLPLAGVDESIRCEVEPLALTEQEMKAFQHLKSGLVVRCWCRVPVGIPTES
jgi:hypothetical protein